jgi:hypothetical protein
MENRDIAAVVSLERHVVSPGRVLPLVSLLLLLGGCGVAADTPTEASGQTSADVTQVDSASCDSSSLLSAWVFDWQAYLGLHPDVVAAGNYSQSAAQAHWLMYGAAAGYEGNFLFSVKQYFAKHPKIATKCGDNYVCGIEDYVCSGGAAGRYGTPSGATMASLLPDSSGSLTAGDAVASSHQVEIVTSSQYGGALSAVKYGGLNFVNNHDHGRQFQMATFHNDWGGCDNPTEAGSTQDGQGATSSTALGAISVASSSGTITTAAYPAFWEQLGQSDYTCPGGYGAGQGAPAIAGSPNDGAATPYDPFIAFSKSISVNAGGDPNIVKYFENIVVSESLADMFVIGMYAAMEPEFTIIETYNPGDGSLSAVSTTAQGTGAGSGPLVYSTTDGNYAMSVVSGDSRGPKGAAKPPTYWVQLAWPNTPGDPENNTSVQQVVFDFTNAVPGNYKTTMYLIIGSHTLVQARLQSDLATMSAGTF